MERHRVVVYASSNMDLAFRNAVAVASLVLIFVVSCSSIAVAAVAVAVDLCNFVVLGEQDADVCASNLQFPPEKRFIALLYRS